MALVTWHSLCYEWSFKGRFCGYTQKVRVSLSRLLTKERVRLIDLKLMDEIEFFEGSFYLKSILSSMKISEGSLREDWKLATRI